MKQKLLEKLYFSQGKEIFVIERRRKSVQDFGESLINWKIMEGWIFDQQAAIDPTIGENVSHVHMFLISHWSGESVLFSSWFFGPLSQWGTKIAH